MSDKMEYRSYILTFDGGALGFEKRAEITVFRGAERLSVDVYVSRRDLQSYFGDTRYEAASVQLSVADATPELVYAELNKRFVQGRPKRHGSPLTHFQPFFTGEGPKYFNVYELSESEAFIDFIKGDS